MSSREPKPFVTVVCKVCETRLDEEPAPEARESFCPICHSVVIIPAAGTPAPRGPVFRTDPNLEGYAVLPLDGPEAEERMKKAQDVILVVCPICRARLHAAPRKEAYQIQCHDCREPVRVPSRSEHRAKAKKEAIPDRREAIEPVPVQATEAPDRRYSSWYLQAQSQIRREPDPRPPDSLYFDSTFTFPWERDLVLRWVYLSLGLSVFSLLGSLLLSMYLASTGGGISMAMAFFALPLVWIGIWTLSYAASLAMAIITDTANGNRTIINWAEQNWRDWVITMAYAQYLVAVAALGGLRRRPAPAACGSRFPLALHAGDGCGAAVCDSLGARKRRRTELPVRQRGAQPDPETVRLAGVLPDRGRIHRSRGRRHLGTLPGFAPSCRCCWRPDWSAWILIQSRLMGRLAWAISRE